MAANRRQFIKLGIGAASASCLGRWLEGPAGAGAHTIYRWCPRFPIAREIWRIPFAGEVEDGMLLETAAGLAARASLHGAWRTLIYEDVDNAGYQRWFAEYCRAHRPAVLRLTLDEAIRRLRVAGIVKGYALYRFERSERPLHSAGPLDESANVATSLAPWLGAVAVSERLVERAERAGLSMIADVRDRSEQWCLAGSGHPFAVTLLGAADPKTRNARSLMVALGAFVCSGRGETYRRALARCAPDSPVVGWGCAGEDEQTIPSSRAGLFQTATNWCHNLTVFAGEGPGAGVAAQDLRKKRSVHWSDLDWGEGRHFANLTLTDGDNVQWIMGNFVAGPEAPSYYGHPERGRIPFGWGLPVPSLAQLSPRTLAEVLQKATDRDDFVLYSGGGYFYPDLYGVDRADRQALRLHAERLRGAMDLTGIRVLAFNFQKWDSAAAMAACEEFASRLPGLLGILAFQYYPYSAGEGAIRWVRGVGDDLVPVVSCRLCVWAQTGRPRDTTPAGVAAWLNRMPVTDARRAGEDCFSWVLVHAWSRFRKSEPGAPIDAEGAGVSQDRDAPGVERGYGPALWTAERLTSRVRLVTVEELLHRVRLRLEPAMALAGYAREVERALRGKAHAPGHAELAHARVLLPRAAEDPVAARECFETLARIARRLRAPRR